MSTAPCEVLTLGETMVALRGGGPLKLGGSLEVSVAGAESNVAIGLARLGHTVRWAGAVGDDEAGELVLRTLRAEGVDLGAATRDAQAPTGLGPLRTAAAGGDAGALLPCGLGGVTAHP